MVAKSRGSRAASVGPNLGSPTANCVISGMVLVYLLPLPVSSPVKGDNRAAMEIKGGSI